MDTRGECKTPGGKLVAVELELLDGRIRSARISGDFFVNPEPLSETVLNALAAALAGLPADAHPAALAARLQAAVPYPAELLGTSPEAIALAVRRAIDGGEQHADLPAADRIGTFTHGEIDFYLKRWKEFTWRVIPESALPPALNVALDEVLTNGQAAGGAPTLRFWRWSEPAVIVGRCQSVLNEVDEAAAAAMGVRIVRRMTGGGAMFLQPHGAITYSIHLPEAALAGLTLRQSYEVCDAWVVRALRDLGVDAHHVPINDIACGEGKIGGAAQARRGGAVLHHTTMAYDMDPGEMVRVLRIGREKLRDKPVASAARRVSPLVRQTGLGRDDIVSHLLSHFRQQFGGTLQSLAADELNAATELVERKYAHLEWTRQFD